MRKASKTRTRKDDTKLPAGPDNEDEDNPAPMETVVPDGGYGLKCVEVLRQMLKGNYHLSNFSRIEYFEFYKWTGAGPTRTRFPKHEIWISDSRLIRGSRKC